MTSITTYATETPDPEYCRSCKQPLKGGSIPYGLCTSCGLLAAEGKPALSPIEAKFREGWRSVRPDLDPAEYLIPQFPVVTSGFCFRVDYRIKGLPITVELDGFDTHSSREDITRDRWRHRRIEEAGWRIIRFGGAEVSRDPKGCAREVFHLITTFYWVPVQIAS
jgi:REase_MTES_1575